MKEVGVSYSTLGGLADDITCCNRLSLEMLKVGCFLGIYLEHLHDERFIGDGVKTDGFDY